MNSEQRWEEQKQIIIFSIFGILVVIGTIFYLIKDNLGLWFFEIAYYDLLIGEKLYKLFGIYKETPQLKELFLNATGINFDWSLLSFVVTDAEGNQYALIDYTIRYYWFINAIFFSVLFGIEFFILQKFSRISKFFFDGIKNKRISLYFNDKELQNFKRKTIKVWDPISQDWIAQFVFNDYFPPFSPEDEGWFKKYIENSIYCSTHKINTSEERYKDIEKVWHSILEEHKVKQNGKKVLPILKKYQFKRFEYMDKDNLLDDLETAEKELSIFITDKNKDYEGVPVRNLFNSKNSNEVIKEYIRKYFNEYYIEEADLKEYNRDLEEDEEELILDWTHILLEELRVYFEVKLFRKEEKTAKTFFNDTKKNQEIKTPLLIPEKFDREKKKKEIINELKRKGIRPTKKEVKERLDRLEKEFAKRNSEKILQAKKYYKNLIYLAYGIKDPKQVRFKQPVLKRTYIMTPFDGMRKLTKFKTLGIDIPAKILNKYIIEDYENGIRKQIKELKEQIKAYSKKGIFEKYGKEEEIANLKALVAELESKLDRENEESRKAKIIELLETHKFEETYLISLWEYGTTLLNLPTGRLSIMKYKNIVLWYALTSLGRPFTFKAGVPIEVMRQIEIEKHSKINRLKEKFEDPDKNIRDFISPETFEELKRNSLDYQEDEDEDIII